MTKRKGDRMIDILKENYQDSETDLALYVGAHKYEDAQECNKSYGTSKEHPTSWVKSSHTI